MTIIQNISEVHGWESASNDHKMKRKKLSSSTGKNVKTPTHKLKRMLCLISPLKVKQKTLFDEFPELIEAESTVICFNLSTDYYIPFLSLV